MDSIKKSILKTITWRMISILSNLVVIYLITKSIIQSIFITILANGVSLVLYYIHERVWKNYK